MADEEVAARAPESDAQEDASKVSGIEGDTKPEQGAASMGEHCTTDRPTPAGETPTGEITKFNDVDVYITKPADYPHSPSKLLLLLTGGTGIHSTNNQLQADKYASEGYLVVMPDQFAGDPAPTTTTSTAPAEQNPSLIEQIKLGVAGVAKSFTIDMWLARHTPEKVLPILNKVITSVQEEFADAVANGGGIYAVGYCFGAKYVLLLGSSLHADVAAGQRAPETEAEEGMVKHGPAIKVGAIAHGTQITKEDLASVEMPVSVVAVDDDPLFPDDVRVAGVQEAVKKGREVDVKVFSGVPHGFAVLGDYADQTIVEKQKEAFGQMLAWLKSH
ncbi:alpha/beta-hydrolase [Teratosphaeria nubilosa]|uniref:Alpha/beta-hydrolase n=1 Tax=Teratosphaeria nubilosa TaxID=161662 RepID=A0A6G1LI68_9PEZI|nr:alpha/beta-hydrolase [Teratosphaeria nubilosa]